MLKIQLLCLIYTWNFRKIFLEIKTNRQKVNNRNINDTNKIASKIAASKDLVINIRDFLSKLEFINYLI